MEELANWAPFETDMKPVGMINISEHLFSVRLEGFFVGLRSNGPAREKLVGIGPRSQDDVISI